MLMLARGKREERQGEDGRWQIDKEEAETKQRGKRTKGDNRFRQSFSEEGLLQVGKVK
jgi:hypothetical protein